MTGQRHRKCPVCGKQDGEALRPFHIEDFDGNGALSTFTVIACNCGMAYNDLPATPGQIDAFYGDNPLYPAQMGVGSGGLSELDLDRYAQTEAFISSHLPRGKSSRVLDVGCAKGGFLRFLKGKGFSSLAAVDLNESMMTDLQACHEIEGKVGSISSIPVPDESVDALILSNLLEHVYDLDSAVMEAERVLAGDGSLVVEIPDASRYAEYRVADYYWFSQFEHINHFDLCALQRLFAGSGLEIADFKKDVIQLGKGARMPSITAVFKHGQSSFRAEKSDLSRHLKNYIRQEENRLLQHRNQIAELRVAQTPIYVWGRGLEMMLLYHEGGLEDCNIRCIIDNNPAKQGRPVHGIPVVSQEAVMKAEAGTAVVITSSLHKRVMKEELAKMGFGGDVHCLV